MAEGDGVWQKVGAGAAALSAVVAVAALVAQVLPKSSPEEPPALVVALPPVTPGDAGSSPGDSYVPPAKVRPTNERDVELANGAFARGYGAMLLGPPTKGPMQVFENEDVILGHCGDDTLTFEAAQQLKNNIELGLKACISVWNKRGGLHSVNVGQQP